MREKDKGRGFGRKLSKEQRQVLGELCAKIVGCLGDGGDDGLVDEGVGVNGLAAALHDHAVA